MSDPAELNPYAPSNLVEDLARAPDPRFAYGGITSIQLGLLTMGAVSVSGALFGATTVFVIGVVNQGFGAASSDFLLFVGISLIYGFIMAGIASVVTVPISVLLFALGRDGAWRKGQIRGLAMVSGGISGFLCIAVISGFDLGRVAFATVPGTFGLLGTLALMEPVARRAERTRQRLLAEALEDSPPPSIDLSPP